MADQLPAPTIVTPVKNGDTTSEWKGIMRGIVGIVLLVVPAILGKLDPNSLGAMVLGIVAIVCAYAVSRGWVKGKASDAEGKAVLAAAIAAAAATTQPAAVNALTAAGGAATPVDPS